MFADDTNFFCWNKEIKPLFWKPNLELGKISEWFQANILSLNEDKTSLHYFIDLKIKIIYPYDYLPK